jgi:chitin disaccharide deacetylase
VIDGAGLWKTSVTWGAQIAPRDVGIAVTRSLIVNADDFGLSAGVNRGIVEAHEHGVVTSASLMVRWPAASAAVAAAKTWPAFSIGLHVDLGEWRYREGAWHVCYQRLPIGDAGAVAAEIDAQLAAFLAVVGRGPTHLDSHQHVHRREPVRRLMLERGERLGVPVRDLLGDVRYQGAFYGLDHDGQPNPDGISYEAFLAAVNMLSEEVIEVGCHPAAEIDFESMYTSERLDELRTLCDPRLRTALSDGGFELASFHELEKRRRPAI